jgi:large subunit ribosomal protein L21
MYAIFRAKGMQFRAEPEATLRIPSLEAEPGEAVTFDEVLLAELEGQLQVGTPSLWGASVSATVVRHGRGEKIVVFKRKRRKGYRRKQGHRQGFTEVKIVGIDVPTGAAKAAKKTATKKPAPPVEKREPEAKKPAAPAEKPKPEAKKPAPAARKPEPAPAADVLITDAARQLAQAHGIDIGSVKGSGKDGRILKSDVDKAIKASQSGKEES